MKGLKIDSIFPWEYGIILIIIGLILIFLGNRQSKKNNIDLEKLPHTRPTTKIIFGGFLIIFGCIQLF
ncbi:MAG: hypothetical protein CMM64_01535, partial [Rhodospirillaceae bacterium]|nr:hypothetical protein [Rhodospirillaceae bacterium]